MPARSASTRTGCVITASPSWPPAGTSAQLLDINPATLRNWIEADERAARPAGGGHDDSADDAAELRRLRQENAELRRANEILKTASAFFAAGGARPSTQVKLCYIHAYRHRFGVEPICAVLSEHGMKIAPQTYYRWLACPIRPAELEEAYLVNQIVDIYRRNKCVYGVRKMWHAARRAGVARRPRPGRPADAHRRHPGCAPRRASHRHDDPRRARTAAP